MEIAGTAARSRRVLITAPIETHWLEQLQDLSPDLQIRRWQVSLEGDVPPDLWREIEILYASFATKLPSRENAPQLRWVQLYSAGPDRVVAHPLFATPVIFTTTSGLHAVNIAEHVFMMILAWYHRFPNILAMREQGLWPAASHRASLYMGEEVWGKTIAIVGYGSIGRQVARLAKTFGMRVLAMQRGTDHRDRGFHFPGVGDVDGSLPDRYYPAEQLHRMLNESDIVVIAAPLTATTRDMFDKAAFHAMKPTSFLVNIARGDLCNEADLVLALQEKRIAGAALDVFQSEPLPPGHPFWRLDNVFISPHSSGLTPLYNERAALIFEENLRRYLAGQPLYNVVDKQQGY